MEAVIQDIQLSVRLVPKAELQRCVANDCFAAIAGIGDRQLSGAPTPSWQRRLYITEYVLLIQPWRLQL